MEKTAADWEAWRGILGRNKRGTESDTGRYKIGDGLSTWRSLNYAGESAGGGGLAIGQQLLLEFNGTQNVVPGNNWQVNWTDSYDSARYTPYPAALPSNELTDLPAGFYAAEMEVDFASPLPEDLKIALGWFSSEEGTGKTFEFGSSPSSIPETSPGPNFARANGMIIIPEECAMAHLTAFCRRGKIGEVGTDPFVINYAFMALTKVG